MKILNRPLDTSVRLLNEPLDTQGSTTGHKIRKETTMPTFSEEKPPPHVPVTWEVKKIQKVTKSKRHKARTRIVRKNASA